MLRGTVLDTDVAEAKRSESTPDSNAQRKRTPTDASLHETTGSRVAPRRADEKLSPKRFKTSDEGKEVDAEGISPQRRTPAYSAGTDVRESQHGECINVPCTHRGLFSIYQFESNFFRSHISPHLAGLAQTNVTCLQGSMGGGVAAGTAAWERQRLLLQELMASSDPRSLSLVGTQQQPGASRAPWGEAPVMTLGGSSAGLFNQQAAHDLTQFLQRQAFNQLPIQGSQAPGMTGLGALSMGMNAYGIPSSSALS